MNARAAGPTAGQLLAWVASLAMLLWLSLRGWGSFQVGVYHDDAVYLVLARSLAFGGRYGLINEPGLPPDSKYPFGFPLLLAPVVRSFADEPLAATAVPLAATLLNVTLLFWGWPLLSPSTSRWWGLAIAGLYGLSPMVVGQTRIVLAEPPFLSFVLVALLLTEASARRRERARRLSFPLGVALMCALFTRAVGAAVVLAVLLRLGAAARRVGYVPLAGVLCGFFASLSVVLALTSVETRHLLPRGYISELSAGHVKGAADGDARIVVGRSLTVASRYVFGGLRRILLPVGGGERERLLATRLGLPFLPTVLGGFIACLVGLGAWSSLRTNALSPSVLLFELFHLVGIALWPLRSDRLLYPVQPFLALQLLLGVGVLGAVARRLWSRSGTTSERPVEVVGVCAMLLVLSAAKSSIVQDTRAVARDLQVGTTWLREHTPEEAVVMAQYPAAIYVHSGRRTAPLEARTAAQLEWALDEKRVDYLLLGPALAWRRDGGLAYDDLQLGLLPAVAELTSRGRLTPVYESAPRDMVRIYQVDRSAADD